MVDMLSLFYMTAMPVLDVSVMAGIGFLITKKVKFYSALLTLQETEAAVLCYCTSPSNEGRALWACACGMNCVGENVTMQKHKERRQD